jgi:hypothetical protein
LPTTATAAAGSPSPSVDVPAIRRPVGGGSLATSARSTPLTPANAARASGANAQLKSWRVLRKIRCCPRRATTLVKAVLVLILAG